MTEMRIERARAFEAPPLRPSTVPSGAAVANDPAFKQYFADAANFASLDLRIESNRSSAAVRVFSARRVMTANVAYCRPDSSLDDVGAIMRERRIRHMPVCTPDGKLHGMISIGDLNAWHADGQATEIGYLTEYIHGRV